MNKSEIMNCAAILAAGIIASGNHGLNYNADMAVELMKEVADAILEDEKKNEIQYKQV